MPGGRPIDEVRASAFTIPSDRPESDGTLAWDATTVIVVEVGAGGIGGRFHDHVRLEAMLFDGCLEPVDGRLVHDRARPGHGLMFKRADVERWAVA